MINMLRTLVEKDDSMQENMNSVGRDGNSKTEK